LDIEADGQLRRSREFDESDSESILEALREMGDTCALDVRANAPGGLDSGQIGELLGTHPVNIRQAIQRAAVRIRASGVDFDEREHPDDPYLRYTRMGEDELAEVTAQLRARAKG
jgi:hypothetical protein